MKNSNKIGLIFVIIIAVLGLGLVAKNYFDKDSKSENKGKETDLGSFYMEGRSMYPTFKDGDLLKPNKKSCDRGDIAVIKADDYLGCEDCFMIKRVVGLPGEVIKLEEGSVYVSVEGSNFSVFDESGYLLEDSRTYQAPNIISDGSLYISDEVGESEYYVFGDNRMNSTDSRRFGPVNKNAIIGCFDNNDH